MNTRRTLASAGLLASLICLGWLVLAIALLQPPDSTSIRFLLYAPEGAAMQVHNGVLKPVSGSPGLYTASNMIQDITFVVLAVCCLIAISACIMILREARTKPYQAEQRPAKA